MSADYTTTKLIEQVRNRGMIPNGARTFSDQTVVDLANDALQSYIVPKLLVVNEGYFLKTEDVTCTIGVDTYNLPARAISGKVRDIQRKVGNGYYSLERIEEERRSFYSPTGTPVGFMIRGNSFVLVPAPAAVETIRIMYYRRPGELVLTSAAHVIGSVTDNGTYYVTDVTYAAAMYDVIKNDGIFDWAVYRVLAENVTGKVAFPKVSCFSAPAAGDYITVTGTSPIPQIPADLRVLLFERTKFECLQALGDPKTAQVEAACERRWAGLASMLSNRSEGKARVILNPNAPGMCYRGSPIITTS